MFTVCNEYPHRVWVAIMFHSPETCAGEGGNFQVMGWWSLDWRSCANVYANDLDDVDNRYWFYYAEADDGASWAGPWDAYVPGSAFDRCYGIGSSDARIVGFREVDVGDSDSFTLTLIG
jgi:uncharacterized membrane protein